MSPPASAATPSAKPPQQPIIKRRAETSGATSAPSSAAAASGNFTPGSHVRHPKYGRGLVLRREGNGDAVKLTVSFPGFGQKKLIEKYAGLEQA